MRYVGTLRILLIRPNTGDSVMARSVYIWTLVFLLVIVHAVAAVITSWFDSTGKRVSGVCRSFACSVLRVAGVKVYVKGEENAPSGVPRIYMSNHQSYFDVIALMGRLPDNGRFVAKKSLEYIPIFGYAMRKVGTIIIDRNKPEEARRVLNEIGGDRMSGGIGVIIFPEGTRSRDGNLGEFKRGGFVLALQTGATIVPVGIHGSREILPAEGYTLKPGEIYMAIGEPIKTDDLTVEDKNHLLDRTKKSIERLMAEAKDHRTRREEGLDAETESQSLSQSA